MHVIAAGAEKRDAGRRDTMTDIKKIKGLSFVKGYFWIAGIIIAVLFLWALWGHTTWYLFRIPSSPHWELAPLRASWTLLMILIICAHLVCATNLAKGKPWVWILSLILCLLTVGSITFPLIIVCIVILLKRRTRLFFGITKEKGANRLHSIADSARSE